MEDNITQQKYHEIAKLIGVDNPPKLIVDTAGLREKGLAGQYQRNHTTGERTITLPEWNESNSFQQKETAVHEITHYLLDKQGYPAGAHGWPFLAVCALLSHKAEIHIDYILFNNIKNWQGLALLNTWGKHAIKARELAYIKINKDPEELQKMTAEEITKEILSTHKSKFPKLAKKYTMITHNYCAKTDGLETLFVHLTFIAFAIGIILSIMKINIGVYALVFSLFTLVMAGVTGDFRTARRRIRMKYWKTKQNINQLYAKSKTFMERFNKKEIGD
ncbi:hypothetical protein [Acidithiobacillus sp.]|uniref:hypothetical protein n=1 Tax=Acidithiobacillus sp. TaxID=1872118 RepID=UPI00262C60EF|nr:hypothetical protein [Acidithiobacillus sp.]MDD5278720.1 hypothetical protein [Acidithiobacillus sp.]